MKPTDHEIIDYLLGDLAEDDQVRLEESLFSDDSLFERLSVIENRLIDLYVLNKLSPEQHKMFEEKYLVSPRRHSDVAKSTQFIHLVDTYRERHAAERGKRWAWLPPFFTTHNVGIQSALASLLLIAAIGFVWLLTERVRLKNRSETAEAALRQKEAELQIQTSNNQKETTERATLAQELDKTKELLRLKEEELQARSGNDESGRTFFATVVIGLTMRDDSPYPKLVIRPRDKFARLIVNWEGEVVARYSISLQRVSSGEVAWKGSASRSGKRLTAIAPASVFTGKNYLVRVDGLSPEGKQVTYKEYSLEVTRQKKQP